MQHQVEQPKRSRLYFLRLGLLMGTLWLLSACVAPDGTTFQPQQDANGSIVGWQIAPATENSAESYYNRGLAYSDQEQWELAIAEYDQAILRNPDYADAYYKRGSAYLQQNEFQLAIADFDRAIGLDPIYVNAYYNRGWIYAAHGEWERAIAEYDQVIELSPTDAEAITNRGWAYLNLGQFEQAIEDFNQAIALDPTFLDAYYNRGVAFAFLGDFEFAIKDFTQAIVLDPTYAFAYHDRGLAYADLGNFESALEDYLVAVELLPDNPGFHNSLCWEYALQQQPETALPYCNQAIQLDPAPNFVDSRGLVHVLLNDFDAAIADFEVFIEALQAQNDPNLALLLEQRLAWVEALAGGSNPITPEVLASLR